MADRRKVARTRRRERKNVPVGRAYIQSTFNNTIVTLTDPNGNVLSWASSGATGFKGSRKGTPYAAGLAAEAAAKRAMENGLRQVEVYVKGPGSGREGAIRSLQAAGLPSAPLPTSRPSRTMAAARPSGEGSKFPKLGKAPARGWPGARVAGSLVVNGASSRPAGAGHGAGVCVRDTERRARTLLRPRALAKAGQSMGAQGRPG